MEPRLRLHEKFLYKILIKIGTFYYNRFMLWLRRILVGLFTLLLFAALMAAADAAAINANLANPNKLESWLADSGIYNHVVSDVLTKSQNSNSQNNSYGSININEPGVVQAANQAFSPSLIQTSVNTVIDANYAWLQGKTKTPTFSIDLTQAKQNFAKNVGNQVTAHLKSIPVCTPQQLTQLQLPVDSLTVTCRPPTLDPVAEGQRVTQDIASGDFLNNSVITASTLGNSNGQSSSQVYYVKFAKLPQAYQAAKQAPIAAGVAALIFALAIIFLARSRRGGLKIVAITLMFTGLLMLAIKYVADTVVTKYQDKIFSNVFNLNLKQSFHVLLKSVEASLVKTYLYFGIGLIVLGLVIIILLVITRNRGDKPKKGRAPQAPVNDAPTPQSQSNNTPAPQPRSDIHLAPPKRPAPRTTDINGSQPRTQATTAPVLKPTPTRKPPKPPKLVQ